MTVELKGHDYKYAVEQMLLRPHGMFHSAGTPWDLMYRGPEVNSVPLRATWRDRVSSEKGGGCR
jgi:hypothetical protein